MGKTEPAVLLDSPAKPFARLLLAHGAGAPMDSPFMNDVAAALAQEGVEVVRFEFPYMAERRIAGKRRPPDRTEKLLATWDEFIQRYSKKSKLPLWIGGKSMGGRMATLWAAQLQDHSVKGVICLGYPFHPPGKPAQLRIEHLPQINIPVLMVQGERDSLGSREEVETYKNLGKSVSIKWMATANHDLKPLRSSGLSHAESIVTIALWSAEFIRGKQI